MVDDLDQSLDGPEDRRRYGRARLIVGCNPAVRVPLGAGKYQPGARRWPALHESVGRESRLDRA